MGDALIPGDAADLLWIAGQTLWRGLPKGTEELQIAFKSFLQEELTVSAEI